ncbi:hypothetical protein [Saliterribacillus persicus]|uniref:Uncharacterized protein n=1 Tax=Saliterribacillus persicus TaxID=930114 RepID=A0A368XRY3_9BACI|nr:hypothetical protein [Saliterribacillus persicus]RCW70625.1 hypothetical protein DFR57_10622 [Saliterribacillus persicus]
MTESIKKKKCFIITPIGSDNSDIRRAAEGLIDSLIIPVLKDEGFEVDVAHRMYNSGSITKSLISRILTDDLVVANLTALNPNVMYEVAIRHATRKPIVQLCEMGTKLPFDIVEERTIFYRNDMLGVVEKKEDFRNMVVGAMKDEEPDNPIYRATEELSVLKDVKEKDPEKYDILKRMDELESTIMSIVNSEKKYNNENNLKYYKDWTGYSQNEYEIKIKLIEPDVDIKTLVKEIAKIYNLGIALTINNNIKLKIKIRDERDISYYVNEIEQKFKEIEIIEVNER